MAAPLPTPSAAEFDDYSAGYSGGMDNPIKKLVGDSPDQFLEVKIRWLLRDLRSLGKERPALLDYGCGLGGMMRVARRMGFAGSMTGCDVSAGMLHGAAASFDGPDRPRLVLQHGARAPLPDASFDVAIVCAVLHHVEPAERPAVFAEVHRLLRPGGRLYVFEHNPWNPATRYVVARTPIDQNAVLLGAAEVRRRWRRCRGGCVRRRR